MQLLDFYFAVLSMDFCEVRAEKGEGEQGVGLKTSGLSKIWV